MKIKGTFPIDPKRLIPRILESRGTISGNGQMVIRKGGCWTFTPAKEEYLWRGEWDNLDVIQIKGEGNPTKVLKFLFGMEKLPVDCNGISPTQVELSVDGVSKKQAYTLFEEITINRPDEISGYLWGGGRGRLESERLTITTGLHSMVETVQELCSLLRRVERRSSWNRFWKRFRG